jgi:hypothetical protein
MSLENGHLGYKVTLSLQLSHPMLLLPCHLQEQKLDMIDSDELASSELFVRK